jgi:hypothetical protein
MTNNNRIRIQLMMTGCPKDIIISVLTQEFLECIELKSHQSFLLTGLTPVFLKNNQTPTPNPCWSIARAVDSSEHEPMDTLYVEQQGDDIHVLMSCSVMNLLREVEDIENKDLENKEDIDEDEEGPKRNWLDKVDARVCSDEKASDFIFDLGESVIHCPPAGMVHENDYEAFGNVLDTLKRYLRVSPEGSLKAPKSSLKDEPYERQYTYPPLTSEDVLKYEVNEYEDDE